MLRGCFSVRLVGLRGCFLRPEALVLFERKQTGKDVLYLVVALFGSAFQPAHCPLQLVIHLFVRFVIHAFRIRKGVVTHKIFNWR